MNSMVLVSEKSVMSSAAYLEKEMMEVVKGRRIDGQKEIDNKGKLFLMARRTIYLLRG